MKNFLQGILAFSILFFPHSLNAQVIPSLEWQKSLGGSGDDEPYSIQQTTDGGFIAAGFSFSNDGNVTGNPGSVSFWVVRLDASGNLVWQKSLGGSADDWGSAVQQTTDGGFIVAGYSESNDGDVSGNHGGYDYWIVKLNSNGNLVWQKSFGGSAEEKLFSIQQTSDGGFIAGGLSYSNDGNVTGNHGLSDFWIVKLNADGNLVWQKSLGGSGDERVYSIQQSADGGFVAGGWSASNDGDVSGHHGSLNKRDFWIVKLDANGNLTWQKSLGGSDHDIPYSLQQTTDGGFIVAGISNSNDGDVSGNMGDTDYWIVKLNSNGNLVWQKSLGGSSADLAYSVQQTADGGFILSGWSESSSDGDVTGNHGGYDYWVVKLGSTGNLVWQKSLGGSNDDKANSLQQTSDGGFIAAGFSDSNDGDVSGNHGSYDYWIVKLTCDCNSITTGAVSGSPFCPEEIVHVPFTSTGLFNTGNVYTAELSDKKGIFSAPTAIGTLTSTANSGTIMAIIPSKPVAGTKYRIRVSASNPIVTGTTNGANLQLIVCAKVIALSASGFTSTSATLSWSGASCAAKYKVQYRKQGTTSWKTKYSTTNSFAITGLLPNTTYEYRVNTFCTESGSSSSGFTSIQTFTTTLRSAAGTLEAEETIIICPNPVEDQAIIQVILSHSSHVYVKVYDLSGQEIACPEFSEEMLLNDDSEQGDPVLSAGRHSLILNTSHFSKGIYVVKMISDSGIENQKLVVQ